MMPMHLAHEPHLERSFRIGSVLSAFAVTRFLLLCWPGGLAPLSFSISSSRLLRTPSFPPCLGENPHSHQICSTPHSGKLESYPRSPPPTSTKSGSRKIFSYFLLYSPVSFSSVHGGWGLLLQKYHLSVSSAMAPDLCPPPLLLPLGAP